MWQIVVKYQLCWRASDNLGIIYLYLADGTIANIKPDSIQELSALGDILRNEKPVYYHTSSGDFCTGWEPTGELEL